jgi:hypothetical protein
MCTHRGGPKARPRAGATTDKQASCDRLKAACSAKASSTGISVTGKRQRECKIDRQVTSEDPGGSRKRAVLTCVFDLADRLFCRFCNFDVSLTDTSAVSLTLTDTYSNLEPTGTRTARFPRRPTVLAESLHASHNDFQQ